MQRYHVSMMSRISHTVMLLLAIALLAGCVARLAYNNAEGYVVREAARYVELDAAQQMQLRGIVRDALIWLGTTRSVEYAGLLRELSEDLGRLDRYGWERYLEQGGEYLEELGEQFAPRLAMLMQSLDEVQREAFFAALESRNVELAEERADIDDPGLQRAEQFERQLRRWLGRLTTEQQALIAQRVSSFETTGDLWLAQRRRWQQTLREALAEDVPEACGAVAALLLEPQALWPEDYAGVIERNRERSLVLLGELSVTLTDTQRQRAGRRLERYAGTLESIGELAVRDWRRSCGELPCPPPPLRACPAEAVVSSH